MTNEKPCLRVRLIKPSGEISFTADFDTSAEAEARYERLIEACTKLGRLFVCALLCLGLVSAVFAQGNQLVVTRAVVAGLDNPPATLTIDGQHFGSSPKVFFGAPGGVYEALAVLQSTDTLIVAGLNTVTPGTYFVVVQSGDSTGRTSSIDVTIGVQGPSGAKGDTGANGATGPIGPQGPSGPI